MFATDISNQFWEGNSVPLPELVEIIQKGMSNQARILYTHEKTPRCATHNIIMGPPLEEGGNQSTTRTSRYKHELQIHHEKPQASWLTPTIMK